MRSGVAACGGGGDPAPLVTSSASVATPGDTISSDPGDKTSSDPAEATSGDPGDTTSGDPGDTSTNDPVNAAPVANAGSDQSVLVGATVTLDGSGSSDANGDALIYAWTMTSRPGGSAAGLSDPAAVSPSFVPDVVGNYVLSLTVNDGTVDSAAATVTVTASLGNVAPVADAGASRTLRVGSQVILDGAASGDANGDTLSHAWLFVSRPSSSAAVLSDANTAGPSFTPDIAGRYVIRLTVSDGNLEGSATVTIDAGPASFGEAPELDSAPAPLPIVRGVSTCSDYRIGAIEIGARLDVPAGASCVLESGARVNGNITVGAGARLYVQGAYLGGNVTADATAVIVVEGAEIAGNANLGNGGEVTLRDNLVQGSVSAAGNTGLVYLTGNTWPTGNLQLTGNIGGVTVVGNQVGGYMTCTGNDPAPTSLDNLVTGSTLGQCAAP